MLARVAGEHLLHHLVEREQRHLTLLLRRDANLLLQLAEDGLQLGGGRGEAGHVYAAVLFLLAGDLVLGNVVRVEEQRLGAVVVGVAVEPLRCRLCERHNLGQGQLRVVVEVETKLHPEALVLDPLREHLHLRVVHGEEGLRLEEAGDPAKLGGDGGDVIHAPSVRLEEALEVGTLAASRHPAGVAAERRPLLGRAVVRRRERFQLVVQPCLLLLGVGLIAAGEMRILLGVVLRRLRVPRLLPHTGSGGDERGMGKGSSPCSGGAHLGCCEGLLPRRRGYHLRLLSLPLCSL